MSVSRHAAAVTLVLATIGASTPARAGGFYLQEQALKETGRALSGGAAAADDPSTIYYNPAAMTQLPGMQASTGGVILFATTKQRNRGTIRTVPGSAATVPVTGGSGGNPFGGVIPIPSFYASAQATDRLWLGVGVNAPFGLKLEYDADFFGRYDSLHTDLKTYNVQPSFAYAIGNGLSVGGGVDVQYVKVLLTSALPNASPSQADGLLRVKGDDLSIGWNAGIFYTLGATSIGLHYRSKIRHDVKGSYAVSGLVAPLPLAANTAVDVRSPLALPDIVTASVAQRLGTRARVMATARWYNWSIFKNITLLPEGRAPAVKDLYYRDSFSVALGGEYALDDKLTLRTGIMYDKTPTNPDFLTTRVPDGDRKWLTAGATYNLSPALALNLSYAHVFVEKAALNRADLFYAGTAAEVATTTVARTSGNVEQIAAALTARF